MFVGASQDIKSFIGDKIATDLGGTKSLFSLAMFVGTSHDIKSIIGDKI